MSLLPLFFRLSPCSWQFLPPSLELTPGAWGRALDSCGLRALAPRLQVGDLAALCSCSCSSSCSCSGSLLGKCSCPISVILFDFCFVKGGARRPQGLGGRSRQSLLSFPFLLFPSFLLSSVSITLLAHGTQKALPKRCAEAPCAGWGSAGIASPIYYSLALPKEFDTSSPPCGCCSSRHSTA